MSRDTEAEKAARRARAAARCGRMAGEAVAAGQRKPSPYASCTPEERIAAAVRLIEHAYALRDGYQRLPRSEWPGEKCWIGEDE